MRSALFKQFYSLFTPRRVEVGYKLNGNYFKITGHLSGMIFYDELEPHIGTRVLIKTQLDEFDIELSSIDYMRRLDELS